MYMKTGRAAASVMKRKVDVLLPPSICADQSDPFLWLIIQILYQQLLTQQKRKMKSVSSWRTADIYRWK